jgi:hypothetical protein
LQRQDRTIPHTIGLIAGRTAQEYNQRKKSKETFFDPENRDMAPKKG